MPTVLLPTAPGTNDLPVRSRRTAHRAAAVRRGASMPARATVESKLAAPQFAVEIGVIAAL